MLSPWEEKLWQNLDSILESRNMTLLTKVHLLKAMVFPVVCMDWESDHTEGWTPKTWCFQTVVLEKTLESPLDSKEIKPVNPKGNQPWIFSGRTDAEAPILWPWMEKSWGRGAWGRSWGQSGKRQASSGQHPPTAYGESMLKKLSLIRKLLESLLLIHRSISSCQQPLP